MWCLQPSRNKTWHTLCPQVSSNDCRLRESNVSDRLCLRDFLHKRLRNLLQECLRNLLWILESLPRILESLPLILQSLTGICNLLQQSLRLRILESPPLSNLLQDSLSWCNENGQIDGTSHCWFRMEPKRAMLPCAV